MSARKVVKSSVIAISAVSLAMLGTATGANASEGSAAGGSASDQRAAIEQLEGSLENAAESGNSNAASSLKALNDLSGQEKAELEEYLTSGKDMFSLAEESESIQVESDIDVSNSGDRQLMATSSSNRHTATCTNTVSFAGIDMTKIEASGTYTMTGTQITSTNSMSMRTVYQYEPFASTSFSNYSHEIVGGSAQFTGTVTVERGAGWNWSTRSADYQVRAYGPDATPGCGFL